MTKAENLQQEEMLYEELYQEYSSYSIVELTDKLRVLEEQPDSLVEIKVIRDVLKAMSIDFNVFRQE